MSDPAASRTLVFWVPDWPIHAHLRDRHTTASRPSATPAVAATPIALVARQRVTACSHTARVLGVRTGIREQEALLRAPDLMLIPHDPAIDAREFEPVLTGLSELVPQVTAIRPGVAAMRARGPARFYGGEDQAAIRLTDFAQVSALTSAVVGIADGRFAAEQVARSTHPVPLVTVPAPGVRVIPPGTSAMFLAPLPVSRALTDTPQLVPPLHGLGIHTLGALAALPESAVRARFGPAGHAAHVRATGRDPDLLPKPTHTPAPTHSVSLDFEPPLASAEQLAFACSTLVEAFVTQLRTSGLVCTELRLGLTDDIGIRHERHWGHPRHFTAPDVLTRLRWQAEQLPPASERAGAGVVQVHIAPIHTDRAAAHEPGLWSTDTSDHVQHHVERVQQLLGPQSVSTARLTGGRLLSERQRLVPWGSAPPKAERSAASPWPGALPAPHPTLVYSPPVPVRLVGANLTPVCVTADEQLDPHPALLAPPSTASHITASDTPRGTAAQDVEAPEPTTQSLQSVVAWSSLWPIRERWWEGRPARYRLQVLLTHGDAWLLLSNAGRWYAEGRYH